MSSLLKNYISFWSRWNNIRVACKRCHTSRTSAKTLCFNHSFPSPSKTVQPVETTTLEQSNIVDINAKQLVTKTEVMWSIDVVLSNYTFISFCNKSDLFCKMFNDSKIADNFACFGLAPYFKEHLTKTLSNLEHIVALFDESFNKTSKRGQIDMHVRYWDNNLWVKLVQRIFSFSAFLWDISESKLLQVFSDGPNVDILEEDRNEKKLSELDDIGTCDVHTSHSSMKHGEKASGSNVKKAAIIFAQNIWSSTI